MPKTVLWAVDAFELEPEILEPALAVLRPLAFRLGAGIQPVHVLTLSRSGVTDYSEIAEAPPAHSFRPAVEHLLSGALGKADSIALLQALVIPVESTSIQAAVDALCRHADSVGAEAIVVSSHGRRGFGRFFLGSFAETLMSRARCPVVVAHPGIGVGGFDRMLFPSDLSAQGHRCFRQALGLARRLGMGIHVINCVLHPVEPILQSGVYLLSGGWMPTHAAPNEQIQALRRTIDLWASEARELGVQARGSIHSQCGEIPETILRIAKQDGAGLIALESRSGPIAAALLGSVAREVVRRSHCPVMVLRGESAKKSSAA